jgi:hypothetical protein
MELRMKVAELCGWKFLKQGVYVRAYPPGTSTDDGPCARFLIPSDRRNARIESCNENAPDYCNDLNACHSFETQMQERDGSEFDRYVKALVNIVNLEGGYYICATAQQRCRAFVETMEAPSAEQEGTASV